MTREQMISTLRGMDFGTVIGSKGDEALRMAISALEQQPCEDAISREAVIGAICDYVAFEEYEDKSHTFTIRPLKKRIDALPSVQPSRKGHWIQLDYQRGKFECSECHTQGYVDTCMYEPKWKYCPICGSYNGGDEIGRSAEMVSKRCKGELYEGEFEER